MTASAVTIFSALTIFTAWLASLIFALLAWNGKIIHKNHGVLWSFLLHWSAAIFLISWIKIPTFLAAFGINLDISKLTSYYTVAFIFRIAAYLLFMRGMLTLRPVKKFWLNTFPVAAFGVLALAVLGLIFITNLEISEIGNIMRVFHYSVIVFLIAEGIRILRKKSGLAFSSASRAGWMLFVFGWIVFLVSDFEIARGYGSLPEGLWFFNLISSPSASIGFSLAHLIIMASVVLIAYGSYHAPQAKRASSAQAP